jgi:hypothetical protein
MPRFRSRTGPYFLDATEGPDLTPGFKGKRSEKGWVKTRGGSAQTVDVKWRFREDWQSLSPTNCATLYQYPCNHLVTTSNSPMTAMNTTSTASVSPKAAAR